MNPGITIVLVTIVLSFTIPVVALYFDFQRRKMRFAERQAMIERGMQPPPLESDAGEGNRLPADPEARRNKLLHDGLVSLFVGIGLGLGAWVLVWIPYTFIPRAVAGPLALAACIVALAGVGLLLASVLTRPRQ